MVSVAALFLLLSYQNLYFGLDQLNGGNNGYWSLLVPGKFTDQPNDKGSTSAAAAAQTAQTNAALAFVHAPGTAASTPAAVTTTSRAPQTGGLGVPGVIGR
jgi:hypothetical protein